MEYAHRPVQVQEVVRFLITIPDGLYVDGTVGTGGHSEAIGQKISSKGHLICLDRDSKAVKISKARLASMGSNITVIKGNYVEMDEILRGLGFGQVNGILLDLGISSYQIEKSGRGFSFNRDDPLDMRMDVNDAVTAFQLVNTLNPEDLKKIFKDYGEEKKAGLIAKAIVRERRKRTINSSRQLANLIQSVIPPSHHPGARHPATRSFQALRIAVNKEIENLKKFLDKAPSLIKKGGRLVIISYHSLEDRLVKRAMINWEKTCHCPPDFPICMCQRKPLFRRLGKKGVKPDQREIEINPRARSAILRAAERI